MSVNPIQEKTKPLSLSISQLLFGHPQKGTYRDYYI